VHVYTYFPLWMIEIPENYTDRYYDVTITVRFFDYSEQITKTKAKVGFSCMKLVLPWNSYQVYWEIFGVEYCTRALYVP